MKKTRIFLTVLLLAIFAASTAWGTCTNAFPTSAKEEFLEGLHDTTDTYKISFHTDSATFGAATTTYSDTNQVTGTGYSAGGFTISSAPTGANSGTTGLLNFSDQTENPVTFTAASNCALLYNSTHANEVIAVFYFASSVQPTAGDLVIDFPASGASTSTIRISELIDKVKRLFAPREATAADRDPNRVDAVARIKGVAGKLGNW